MRGPRAVALVLGIVSCNQGDIAEPRFEQVRAAPRPDFSSGTRLKARYYVVDGLVQVFTTFHDAQLDLDCAFDDDSGAHVGPGAASYCLPPGMAQHRAGHGPFLDSLCTTAVALAPSGEPATYALVEPRNACTTAPAVHRVKAPEMRRAFVLDDTGRCVAGAPTMIQTFAGSVPLDTFVRATEQVEDTPGRIGARVLVGDDGSRRVVGGFDRHHDEPVRPATADDGLRRWLPTRVAFIGAGDPLFSDAACSVMVASKIARTATCPINGWISAATVATANAAVKPTRCRRSVRPFSIPPAYTAATTNPTTR